MSTYVQYQVDDGSVVLVEVEGVGSSIERTSLGGKTKPIQASKKFNEALANVGGSIKALIKELDSLKVEEAEIKFGLKSVCEAGIGNGLFAITKVGGEMNYEITLKWKRPKTPKK